jgi:hypothetical protein
MLSPLFRVKLVNTLFVVSALIVNVLAGVDRPDATVNNGTSVSTTPSSPNVAKVFAGAVPGL